MATRDVFNRMPTEIIRRLDQYKAIRRNADTNNNYKLHDEITDKASAYTTALMDAGVVTDRERMYLFIYTTM